MALTPEQKRIVNRIKQIGARQGASPKEIKAALETGIVESNLRNLPGGDRDSAGWRQERASLYKNPTNLDESIKRFFKETSAVKHKYGRAGDLAAAVQRPAAQYRGRYQDVSEQAQRLMGNTPTMAARSAAMAPKTTTTTTPGVDNSAARGQLVAQFLQRDNSDPLDFAMGIRGLQDVPGETSTVTTPGAKQAAPAMTSQPHANNALEWAKSKIGNKETGVNSGGLASFANQRFGMSGQPWCAMFTSLAATKGGAPASARTASVAEVRRKAQQGEGYVRGFIPAGQAKAGDLITFGTRHIGMVESVKGNRVTMIAGNDSDRVQRRTVTLGADDKIVRPAYGRK